MEKLNRRVMNILRIINFWEILKFCVVSFKLYSIKYMIALNYQKYLFLKWKKLRSII